MRAQVFTCCVVALLTGAWSACTDRVDHPGSTEIATSAFEMQQDESSFARVDGRGIGVEELMDQWRKAPARSRDDVVDTVVDRDVAAHRLLESGRLESDALRRQLEVARKSAMVRTLLEREVESAVTADNLEAEAVAQRMEAIRRQVGRPRGLQVSHLLVSVPERADPPFEAAERWLKRIRDDLGETAHLQDLYEVAERVEPKLSDRLEIVIDPHLVFPLAAPDERSASLPEGWSQVVEPFRQASAALVEEASVLEAMESAESGRTPTSAPVRTKYGWHVIVPERLLPAKQPEEGPLRALAKRELLREKRRQTLQTWMGDLAARTDIVRFKDNLSDDKE